MLIVISPAKTLDYETPVKTQSFTQPSMLEQSATLINVMRKKSPLALQHLMGISKNLAELNAERYKQWSLPFKPSNARQAALAFKGDVYLGLQADKFTESQLQYAQDHLRILSGLYGLLRPLDLIQPYRLEMGTKLKMGRRQNLYQYWGSTITEEINRQLASVNSELLVNLASKEYFRSVKPKELNGEVVTPVFRDWSNGQYRMIGFFAKKARGTMAAWLLKSRAKSLVKLKRFAEDGYRYSEQDSTPTQPVFIRKTSP